MSCATEYEEACYYCPKDSSQIAEEDRSSLTDAEGKREDAQSGDTSRQVV